MQDVKTWMTRASLTIESDASALEVIGRMQEGGFRNVGVNATPDLGCSWADARALRARRRAQLDLVR
jgi:hypothetical protein